VVISLISLRVQFCMFMAVTLVTFNVAVVSDILMVTDVILSL